MSSDGESLEENTAKLEDEFNQIGLTLFDLDGSFKSTYDILRELSGEWDGLSDTVQASLTYLISGVRRSDILTAALTNMESITGSTETALNSLGSAIAENDVYMDSITAKTKLFQKAVDDLWIHTINSDSIKNLVDMGTAIVDIIDNMGLLSTVTIALGGVLGAKYLPLLVVAIGKSNLFTEALIANTAAATALNVALGAGVALAIIGLIKLADELTVSLEEQKEKVSNLETSLGELSNEYQNLINKQSSDELKSSEKRRIEFLENELALQRQLLDIETKRLAKMELGREPVSIPGAVPTPPTELAPEAELLSLVGYLRLADTSSEAYIEALSKGNQLAESIVSNYEELGQTVPGFTQTMINELMQLVELATADPLEAKIEKIRQIEEEYELAFKSISGSMQGSNEVIQKSLEELQKEYIAYSDQLKELQSIQEQLNEDNVNFGNILSDLTEKYPELASQIYNVADAELVIGEAIKQAEMETNASYAQMNRTSAQFWENALKNGEISTETLIKLAGISAEEFGDAERSKAKVAQMAANSAMSAWSSYFGKTAEQLRAELDFLIGMGDMTEDVFIIMDLLDFYDSMASATSEISTNIDNVSSSTSSAAKATQTYIDKLKEQLEIEKNIYEDQKSALEAQKDALDDQITAEDRLLELKEKQLAVEKAQAELAGVLEQKTVRLLTEEGWTWIADPDAVESAQEALRTAEKDLADTELDISREIQEEAIQRQIDALSAQSDAISEFISDMGRLNDEVANNVNNWRQLISALNAAGISYSDIGGARAGASSIANTGSISGISTIPISFSTPDISNALNAMTMGAINNSGTTIEINGLQITSSAQNFEALMEDVIRYARVNQPLHTNT